MNFSKLFVKTKKINNILRHNLKFTSTHATCPKSTPKRFKLTLMDSTTPMGESLALMLKQNSLIKELRLYDDKDVKGIAKDLNDIDTSTKIIAYCGEKNLREAIEATDVVVNCSGYPKNPYTNCEEIFEYNADDIRRTTAYLTEFNRNAVYCITRPLVEALVPMVYQEYKKAGVKKAAKKIIGMANYSMMRANCSIAQFTTKNTFDVTCPIIGGVSPEVTLAVVSGSNYGRNIYDPRIIETIQELTAHGLENVNCMKIKEKSHPVCHAPAVAAYRLIDNILRGLRGDKYVYDCAFLRQENHLGKYLPYMASIVQFGKDGVQRTYMPYINGGELHRLKRVHTILKAYINLGESYVNGFTQAQELSKNPHCAIKCDENITTKTEKDVQQPLEVKIDDPSIKCDKTKDEDKESKTQCPSVCIRNETT